MSWFGIGWGERFLELWDGWPWAHWYVFNPRWMWERHCSSWRAHLAGQNNAFATFDFSGIFHCRSYRPESTHLWSLKVGHWIRGDLFRFVTADRWSSDLTSQEVIKVRKAIEDLFHVPEIFQVFFQVAASYARHGTKGTKTWSSY